MQNCYELMRIRLKRVFVILFVVVAFLVFIKMCSVTALDIDNREPLRQIDNWE